MKKTIVLFLVVFSFIFSTGATGQTKINYSGKWKLDINKSKIPYADLIKSMVKTVNQTKNNIEIKTNIIPTSNAGIPDIFKMDDNLSGGKVEVYSLDNKEVADILKAFPLEEIPITRRANIKSDGKLELITNMKFPNSTKDLKTSITENWELSADKKTLKIIQVINLQNDKNTDNTVELVFVKD